MAKETGYISMVQDILELAEKLKSSDPNQRIIFADSDFNEYLINVKVDLTCVGEALNLDFDTMQENGGDYFEECVKFEIES